MEKTTKSIRNLSLLRRAPALFDHDVKNIVRCLATETAIGAFAHESKAMRAEPAATAPTLPLTEAITEIMKNLADSIDALEIDEENALRVRALIRQAANKISVLTKGF